MYNKSNENNQRYKKTYLQDLYPQRAFGANVTRSASFQPGFFLSFTSLRR